MKFEKGPLKFLTGYSEVISNHRRSYLQTVGDLS